jgi:hypothetical protein
MAVTTSCGIYGSCTTAFPSSYSVIGEATDINAIYPRTLNLLYSRTTISGRGENKTRAKAPACSIILLSVAHSSCETSQKAQKISRLQAFSRLSRLSKFDCTLNCITYSRVFPCKSMETRRSRSAGHIRSAFAPKLAASQKLTASLAGYPLQSAMAFSSAAALLGAPGQGNYAAANAAMDSFVSTQAARGLPLVSVQWGAWGAGIPPPPNHPPHKRSVAEGVDIFNLNLSHGEVHGEVSWPHQTKNFLPGFFWVLLFFDFE